MPVVRALKYLAIDALAWYCLPAAFLILYVRQYGQPASAVVPHLLVLALPFAALTLVRLVAARLIPVPALQRALCTLLSTGLLAAMLVYYAFVLIGLSHWGGVVSRGVIPTFFIQAPQLADALGAPRPVLFAALGLIPLGLLAGCWLYLGRFDWPSGLKASTGLFGLIVVAGMSGVAVETYQFANASWVRVGEPVSLTLFPSQTLRYLEGHVIDPQAALQLDRAEDAARAAYVPSAAPAKRNLILIVVDALRPDHMGIFGYARPTTPKLDSLKAAGSVREVVVHASCGDTVCGLLSLSDSKFPRTFSFRPFGLHEVLRRNGYRVNLILTGDHTNFYSLKNYYGKVDLFYDGTQAHGYFLNDDQLAIDRVAAMPAWDGVPTMFQFHLMSAHILRKADDGGEFQPAARYVFKHSRDTGPADSFVESATNFYDNGVLKTDAVIAELLQTLQHKGFLRDALVVVTADHGESLGEHGLFLHANSVREELLRIPLVMIAYGYRPDRSIDARNVPRQVDIAPTILAELGIPQPATWVGRPLQESGATAFSYFEEHKDVGLIDARARQSTWKYWRDSATEAEHAFDLQADPHEKNDLVGTVPASLLAEWRVRAVSGTPLVARADSR